MLGSIGPSSGHYQVLSGQHFLMLVSMIISGYTMPLLGTQVEPVCLCNINYIYSPTHLVWTWLWVCNQLTRIPLKSAYHHNLMFWWFSLLRPLGWRYRNECRSLKHIFNLMFLVLIFYQPNFNCNLSVLLQVSSCWWHTVTVKWDLWFPNCYHVVFYRFSDSLLYRVTEYIS